MTLSTVSSTNNTSEREQSDTESFRRNVKKLRLMLLHSDIGGIHDSVELDQLAKSLRKEPGATVFLIRHQNNTHAGRSRAASELDRCRGRSRRTILGCSNHCVTATKPQRQVADVLHHR